MSISHFKVSSKNLEADRAPCWLARICPFVRWKSFPSPPANREKHQSNSTRATPSSANPDASEGLGERDLSVLLLQFLEENLGELLGDHGASTIHATFNTPGLLLPQEQQQGTKLQNTKPLPVGALKEDYGFFGLLKKYLKTAHLLMTAGDGHWIQDCNANSTLCRNVPAQKLLSKSSWTSNYIWLQILQIPANLVLLSFLDKQLQAVSLVSNLISYSDPLPWHPGASFLSLHTTAASASSKLDDALLFLLWSPETLPGILPLLWKC